MATIKSCTDIEQSKKLAEILPLESANMWWVALNWQETEYYIEVKQDGINQPKKSIPCWSLAALLEEIPSIVVNNVGEDLKLHIDKDSLQYSLFYENEYTGDMFEIETESYENMVDACYEMILKLKENNLI